MLRLWTMALLIALSACAPEPTGDVDRGSTPVESSMIGLLVTDEPVMVAPNPQWVADREADLWGFVASGTLAVYVTRPPSDPLEISLELRSGDPESLFCSWDGAAVPASWIATSASRLEVRVPVDRLGPGSHALSVVRTDQPVVEGEGRKRLEASDLRWRIGDHSVRIEPDRLHRYHYIASFLLEGVTGSMSTERLDGALLIGPRRVSVPVSSSGPGELRFTVQNSSSSSATFAVSAGDRSATVVVDSHQKTPLAISLDGSEAEVELATDGPSEGLFLWGAPRLVTEQAQGRTPIVLVTLDTTRRDVVPPYSGDDRLMPNLAALARHGTVYRRAVATSPWTLPSHASMLTGLYPSRHRAGVTDQELVASKLTAPEVLRRRGWLTAGFAGGLFCASRFGLSQGFAIYHDPEEFEVPGDRLTDLALAFLDDAAESRPMVFVNYFDPHFPYRAPERLQATRAAERFGRVVTEGSIWRRILDGDGAAWTRAVIDDIPFPADAIAALRAEYRAEVAFVDEQLGRLTDGLKEHALWDDALVIVVADHGELIGEHRVLGHGGRLDPELVEVPLIVKFPHQQEPVTVTELVSIVDIFPTILDTAGLPIPASDGIPLPRRDDASAERGLVFSEEHAMGIHTLFGRLLVADSLYGLEERARRQVVWRDGGECFTLERSRWVPGACVSETPMDLVEDLLSPPRLLAGQKVPGLAEEEMERLRALGYAR